MEVSPIECPKEIKIFQGNELITNEDISPKLTGFEYEILESIDDNGYKMEPTFQNIKSE